MDTGRSKASSPLATTSLLDPVENKASSAAKPLAGTATGDAPLATAKRHATEAQTLHTYKNVLRRGLTSLLNPVKNKGSSAAKLPYWCWCWCLLVLVLVLL